MDCHCMTRPERGGVRQPKAGEMVGYERRSSLWFLTTLPAERADRTRRLSLWFRATLPAFNSVLALITAPSVADVSDSCKCSATVVGVEFRNQGFDWRLKMMPRSIRSATRSSRPRLKEAATDWIAASCRARRGEGVLGGRDAAGRARPAVVRGMKEKSVGAYRVRAPARSPARTTSRRFVAPPWSPVRTSSVSLWFIRRPALSCVLIFMTISFVCRVALVFLFLRVLRCLPIQQRQCHQR